MFDTEKSSPSADTESRCISPNTARTAICREALVNYLAQMSWTPENGKEIFLEEACQWFDIKKVSKSPAVFDIDKLNWFNAHYIRSLPIETVVERAMPYLADFDLSSYSQDSIKDMIELLRESLVKLADIKDSAAFFFGDTVPVEQEVKDSVLTAAS
ncbi:MAG: glutamate--tRNA ligase family protein [Cyanobacteriota/Melainabacteria group bacterium]